MAIFIGRSLATVESVKTPTFVAPMLAKSIPTSRCNRDIQFERVFEQVDDGAPPSPQKPLRKPLFSHCTHGNTFSEPEVRS